MLRHRTIALALSALMLGGIRAGGAATLPSTEDAPIVGGTAALARSLGINPAPDRARFVAELARIVYDVPEGKNAQTDELLRRLTAHLDVVGRFQDALAAVQGRGAGIALAMAARREQKRRLQDFLDLLGLKLRDSHKQFHVERTDNKEAAERLKLLADLGIDLGQLALQLNRGETVRVDVPTETVPIPLPAAVWSAAVFQHQVAAPALVAAILSDRRAALLCHGLAALDAPTLGYLVDHPEIVTRLYEHDAPAFAAFGDALHIRDGRVVPPGGPAGAALWEAAGDRQTAQPERFVRELFGRNGGRLAYLYDIVAHLDPARARFALGLWIPDAGERADRFAKLVSAVAGATSEWKIDEHPFARPAADAGVALAGIAVTASGAPAPPSSRRLWERAFDSADLPGDPAGQLKDAAREGSIDAAWLVEVLGDVARVRSERIDQLALGQRAFAAVRPADLPSVLVALRGTTRYRMLMLTLERIGVRKPSAYAAAARDAERLSSLDANRAFIALEQFQSALAILTRLVRMHVLDQEHAEALTTSLLAVPLDDDGGYGGGVARWMTSALLPAIGGGDADAVLLGALSGNGVVGARPIEWEGRQYRLDLTASERRRLDQVRHTLGGAPVSTALGIEEMAARLRSSTLTLADVKAAAATLKSVIGSMPPRPKGEVSVVPPGVDEPKRAHEVLVGAVQDLSRISKPKNLKKAARTGDELTREGDALLGAALARWVYALDLGDPKGTPLLGGDVSRRHDFGFADKDGEIRIRTPWAVPDIQIAAGVPWHVKGSLLGLDVGLATLTLRRTTTERVPRPPVLTAAERDGFTRSVALLNPNEMTDGDRDAIVEGIYRGRARVTALDSGAESLDRIADAIAMDGWRRRALAWTLANDRRRVLSYFSLEELLTLGGGSDRAGAWGVDAGPSAGCLCLQVPASGSWPLFVGRPSRGVMATRIIDLNLRVAIGLHARHLPAALAKDVLAAATQDYIDEVQPTDDNDWLTLVRTAGAIPSDRLDDDIAALTAAGPLMPWVVSTGGA